MRLALAKATWQIPPTYFAVQHALALQKETPDIDVHAFTFASDVRDPAVRERIPVTDAAPARLGPFQLSPASRSRLAWVFQSQMEHEIRAWSPDVVHQHAATWSLPAVHAARALGVPLVTTLHGADAFGGSLTRASRAPASRIAGRWMQRNLDAASQVSAAVLAVSRYLADTAVRNGVPAHRLRVHYQGVDTDWFAPAPTPAEWSHARDHSRELLFVGALTPLKGIMDLLAVSESLALIHPHRLTIVGDGPLAPQIRRAAALDPGRVRWVGALDRAAVRERMRAADALVLPTRTMAGGRAEAAGLVLLEAQACATPVVANAVGGTPEMMVDGSTGFATRERDPGSLADALTRILAMPDDELAEMGCRARRWVVAERSLAASTRELLGIYRDLTEAAPRI
ncbi:glycosyltransferase [Schaalia naturae]|uniref:Glycosyltransferase n=1 Tax=Schaalia naturae TaxID=635203 RepID=A0ABW2SLD8_9ACTO